MILLDPRAGSADYVAPLRALGADVEVTTLEYGDAAFTGTHTGIIGVELKRLGDVLNCIDSGRFAGHQLPGLLQHYDAAYLIVEGLWRPSPTDGVLEAFRGSWVPVKTGHRHRLYRELDNWLTTMEVLGGVHVRRTGTEHETARTVFDLHDWYVREDEHKSHLAFDSSTQIALQSQLAKERRRNGRGAALFPEQPSPKRVFASMLPRIGVEKSGMVAGAFESVRAMVNAPEADWLKIPGIGKKMVGQIRAWLDEG